MKKFFFTGGISLAASLLTLLVTNFGSPAVKGVVSWLNPPQEVLSVRGQMVADSLEAGDGWQADGENLVHNATGLVLSIAKKDEKDLGKLSIRSNVPTTVQPKYSESDLRLLRAYYDKRLSKIEDAVETQRLEGLRPTKPAASTKPPTTSDKLKDLGKAAIQKLETFRHPAPPADAHEELGTPRQEP